MSTRCPWGTGPPTPASAPTTNSPLSEHCPKLKSGDTQPQEHSWYPGAVYSLSQTLASAQGRQQQATALPALALGE